MERKAHKRYEKVESIAKKELAFQPLELPADSRGFIGEASIGLGLYDATPRFLLPGVPYEGVEGVVHAPDIRKTATWEMPLYSRRLLFPAMWMAITPTSKPGTQPV